MAKRYLSIAFFALALVLVCLFAIMLRTDLANDYAYGSASVGTYVLYRAVCFLLPALICGILGAVFMKR